MMNIQVARTVTSYLGKSVAPKIKNDKGTGQVRYQAPSAGFDLAPTYADSADR
jgi:hypothetical protein